MQTTQLISLPDIIETPRLRLRPFDFTDIDDIYAYAADPDFLRYLGIPQPYTHQSAREFVARQILLNKLTHIAWAIELHGRNVGGINIRFFEGQMIGELGYSIAKRCWGKGYMTEAAGAVVNTAFEEIHGLCRMRAMCDLRNVGSFRVMQKIGMTREAVLRQNRLVGDEVIDEVWAGILRSEWEAQTDVA